MVFIFANIDIGEFLTPMLPMFDVWCKHRPNTKKYSRNKRVTKVVWEYSEMVLWCDCELFLIFLYWLGSKSFGDGIVIVKWSSNLEKKNEFNISNGNFTAVNATDAWRKIPCFQIADSMYWPNCICDGLMLCKCEVTLFSEFQAVFHAAFKVHTFLLLLFHVHLCYTYIYWQTGL